MKLAILSTAAALALAAAGTAAASGYHGLVHVDYRYTSGAGALTPGGAADVEQTAHLDLTVVNGRIVRLHGVVGFDWKERFSGCPDFTVETTGGGTVAAKPTGGEAFMDDWNWTPPRHGHYVTPEPAVPPAHVTSMTTSAANDCSTLHQTDKATFEIGYVPPLSGSLRTPTRLVGSLTRTYQGYDACHPFSPLPPPPPVSVSCTWKLRWTLTRKRATS